MLTIEIKQNPEYKNRFEEFVVPEIGKLIIVDWKELDVRGIDL